MKQVVAVLSIVIMIAAGTPALAQLKVVENSAPLTEKQKAVLAVVQKVPDAILRNDKAGFTALLAYNDVAQKVRDANSLQSCVIFDTLCTRAFLKKEADKRAANKQPRTAQVLLKLSQTFISVREFLEKNKTQMQVTFQPQPEPTVQVELHTPRRANVAKGPPFGQYESLSMNLVPTGNAWKITVLFPEPYQFIAPYFR
jgi:hypothetical protein